jgi:hypothetical protein
LGIIATVLGLASLGACGSSGSVTAGGPESAEPAATIAPDTPLFLAQFEDGIGAVAEGAAEPVWTEPDAVAAPDGSAVFSMRDGGARLVRLDPRTGEQISAWPLQPGFEKIAAVAPDGRWVALTVREPDTTEVVVFDPDAGAAVHRIVLPGDVYPEAFSVDGSHLFALVTRGDHYRVQTIDVATGERYDTTDRDKTQLPEDMNGVAVHGVLSADRTLLATLYRNPVHADEPAFVHVLDLQYGWSYCADLPPPFGTGPAGSDAIELTPADTVVVSTTHASRIAEIHIEEVHTPGDTPVTVEFRDEPNVRAASGSSDLPGFAYLIAVLPAR